MDESYRHPAFPQPEEDSVALWRYMTAEKFKWLVEYSRLFMASADRLGDPMEGTTPRGELEWWMREAANADTEERRQIIKHNRGFLSRMAQGWRSKCYVSCWHMNPYENRAMWGCYTNGPESVAVRTTYAALRANLPRYIEMGTVRYIDYAVARLPSMNMFEYVMHKDTYYDFEREARAVVLGPAGVEPWASQFHENHFQSENIPGFLIFAPPVQLSQLVHAVVLHPEASSTFEAEMIDLCATKGLAKPESSRRNRAPAF
jgi:hypothetical protein